MASLALASAVAFLSLVWSSCLVHPQLLVQLNTREPVLTIKFKSNDLSILDICIAILFLIVKSIKSALGLGPRLHIAKSRPSSTELRGSAPTSKNKLLSESHYDLPSLSVRTPLDIRLEDVEQYLTAADIIEAAKIADLSVENLTYRISSNTAHLLLFFSAITEPALLLLLARAQCPINPLGAVNVRNRFQAFDLAMCKQVVNDLFETSSRSASPTARRALQVLAQLDSARDVSRGVEIDIRVSVLLEGENVQHSAGGLPTIFEQIFTVLEVKRNKGADQRRQAAATSTADPDRSKDRTASLRKVLKSELRKAPQLASYFRMDAQAPLQWARLCKDYNPIHTSSVVARLFGFRSKIAHGNHVVAKAVHALSNTRDLQLESFCNGDSRQGRSYAWMEVRFKRPVILPVEVGTRVSDSAVALEPPTLLDTGTLDTSFEVFREDKVHVHIMGGH